jgi:phage-related protein
MSVTLLLWPLLFGKVLLASRGMMIAFGTSILSIWKNIWIGVARLAPIALRALMGPWGLAITAIFLLLVAFKDQVAQALHAVQGAFTSFGSWINQNFKSLGAFFGKIADGIVNAFWALPEGVRNAMLAVIHVVAAAAKQVYEWMSYLNPFARHSPSLVDQVNAGTAAIAAAYSRTASTVAKQKANITKADIANQEKVVDRWKAALDRANDALDIQQGKLDRLKDHLSVLTDAYDAHKQAMDNFASAPLKGMQAMSDAIFDNQMAQKKLQLQMAQWQQVNGSLDDAANKLADISGQMEQLRGESQSLRLAGAGSDVLGPIDAQVAAMQQAADQLRQTTQNSPIAEMQKQLDLLQQQGDILDLQQSINFDPLTRQLDLLAHAQKEINYDDAVAGIKNEQSAMAALQPQIDTLTAAVNKQQAVVQKAKDARDQIADRYDKEREKLAALKKAYDDLHGSMASANLDAKKGGLGFAASSFEASKAGNFPSVGGDEKIGREGSLKDQSKLIEEFTKQTTDEMGNIWGGFDMFGPFKKKWGQFKDWMKTNFGPVAADFKNGLDDAFSNMGGGMPGLKSGIEDTFTSIWKVIKPIWDQIMMLVDLLAPDFKRMFDAIVKSGKRLWKEVGPNIIGLMKDLWPIVKVVAAVLGVVLVGALKIVTSILGHVFGPVLDTVISVLNGLISFIRGVVNIIVGIFTLDLSKIWEGVRQVFGGLWQIIWGILSGVWNSIIGVIEGLVGGIVGWFQWLYDELVGHSIVPDIVDGIVFYFELLLAIPKWIWNHVLKPLADFFVAVWKDWIKPGIMQWWQWIKDAWGVLKNLGQWVWDNVLKPVAGFFKSIWTDEIKPGLVQWVTWIKAAWSGLKNLGTWVWDNVMSPIIQKFKDGWNAIKDWLTSNKDMLLKPVKGVVNVVIKAVNALISGLNLVSKALPGISFHIEAIPEFAKGGPIPSRRVGNGFVTNGARAIVGEGKANYPEYVIPTDPTYRARATKLLASAAQRLNLGVSIDPSRQGILGDTLGDMRRSLAGDSKIARNAVPMYDSGGLIGVLKGAVKGVKSVGNWATGNLQELASTPFKPYLALAQQLVDQVDYKPVRGLGNAGVRMAKDFITGADTVYAQKAKDLNNQFGGASGAAWNGSLSTDARIARAQKFAASQVGKPYIWGGVGPDGYDCSGFMSALTNVILGRGPHSRLGTTGSFPWSGFAGGASPNGFTIGSTRSYAGGVGHMAGTLAGMNVESRGGRGVVIGSSARGYGDSGFTTRAHLVGLQQGAIIRARMGGTVFRGGEGTNDEAIVPLPKQWRQTLQGSTTSDSKTVIVHIHGNLEFPNIDNADDVHEFIKNLEILARD